MRAAFTALAAMAIVLGVWVVLPDILAWGRTSEQRLHLAARIGVVRADLWARMGAGDTGVKSLRDPLEPPPARRSPKDATRALRLSPLLSSQWLLLSKLTPPPGREPALTMAFFTGPGERGDVPARLETAAQSLPLDREELCDLLRPDVNFALKQSNSSFAGLLFAASKANQTCLQRLGVSALPEPQAR